MKFSWRSAIGIALSVVLLWWTLRDVSMSVVWHELAHSSIPLFLASAFCATIIFPLRARRWQIILQPVAPNTPMGPLWRSTAIGMMVNNLVPARAGEVARAYALTKQTTISLPTSIASLAVDRLFDMLVLLLLGAAAFLDPAFPSGAHIAGQSLGSLAQGSIAFVALLIVALYSLAFFPQELVRAYELFARRISPSLESKGKAVLINFSEGLSVLRSPQRFLAVLAWTILHWLVNALAFWLGFKAVGMNLPFSAALFLQTLIAIGVALPSAPGFFGVFEKLANVGLAIYGVGADSATSWAIGYHILSFIPITVIGVYYFVHLGLHFKEIETARESTE
ncbi:MAG TPA: lysylphosphatidylglycerol synthase transmembrane domain-containing protein [Gemmatimonadaceae bacterium]|nr:lysylphosphatidylglycerol synthase transmembrane domain-containing protein [Gemmatimonadaceae bacterium]